MRPLVTVGVPTFNRPHLLRRSLSSLVKQDYPNIRVIVSDNASMTDEARDVVESFADCLPDLEYHRHETSVGPIGNFMWLLERADGPYFMWLADDDEISPNYVSALVAALECDPGAASAAGHWILVGPDGAERTMRTSRFEQTSAAMRALNFVWRSDDSFFYALHRTEALRRANFAGFAWPNRRTVVNWAYVFLLDLVIHGKIVLAPDRSVRFFNHDYTLKSDFRPGPTLGDRFARAARRLNVHAWYVRKCATALGARWVPLVLAVSAASLLREAVSLGVTRSKSLPA